MGFESGDFSFYRISYQNEKVKIFSLDTDKTKDHYDLLTAIDYHRGLNLLISSCTGGLVKIWHAPSKTLIREIKFPDKVDSVCFMNNAHSSTIGDILIAHEKRISQIKF